VFVTLGSLTTRIGSYKSSEVSETIDEQDIMLARAPGALNHYMSVGRSAIDVIAQTMAATKTTSFRRVLDLPCGGGRVTRHLVKFFPDSEIFISDLDRRMEDFTAQTFGVKPIISSLDFATSLEQKFDLIFVGSLVTHLDQPKFKAAIKWFINALEDGGIAIITAAGRRSDWCQRNLIKTIKPESWQPVSNDMKTKGFGYIETERNAAGSYGLTLSAPSWVLALLEQESSVRVVAMQEAAWDNHQDFYAVQKQEIQ
jgi:SAM-dependent methyltransferase